MTTTSELRELCAQKLLQSSDRAAQLTAFVGLDGFVDEILHAVDKRMDAQNYEPPSFCANGSENRSILDASPRTADSSPT